jgi:hypothetical protein
MIDSRHKKRSNPNYLHGDMFFSSKFFSGMIISILKTGDKAKNIIENARKA